MKKYLIFLVIISTIVACNNKPKEPHSYPIEESTLIEDSANFMVTQLVVNVSFIDTGKVFEEDSFPVLKRDMRMTMPIYADTTANVKVGDTLKLCADYGPMPKRIDDPNIWHVEYSFSSTYDGMYEVDHCSALTRVVITKINSKSTVFRNSDDIITN